MTDWPLSAYIGIALACLSIGFGVLCCIVNEMRRRDTIRDRLENWRTNAAFGDWPNTNDLNRGR